MATLAHAAPLRLRRRLRDLDPPWALLGAVALARTVLGLALGPATADDAYISFRYARNLADGHGLVYNAGEQVLGTTTPLWTLLLTPFQAAGLDLAATALVIALACDVVSALLLRSLLARLGYGPGVAFGAAVLFLCIADFLGLARSGMETSLFVLLVLLTLERLAREQPAAATAAACAALLTRPEGALALALVAGWCALTRTPPNWRRALPALALVAAWVAFATAYYGSPVPQSVVAKAASESQALRDLSWHNLRSLFVEGQFGGGATKPTWIQGNLVLSLLALIGLASVARTRMRALLLAAFPLAYLAALASAHAFTYFPWYYGPLYPFLCALAAIGAAALRPRLVAVAIPALVALQVVALVAVKLPAERDHFWVRGLSRSAAPVPDRPGVTIAATEIGVIGWENYPARIDDLAGLVTPGVVNRRRAAFVRDRRPDYVALRTDIGAPVVRALENEPALERSYRLVLRLPDPGRPFEYRLYKLHGRS